MTCKLYPNWKFYPFLKNILYVFHFEWLLGCDFAVDEQTIFSKVDMRIRLEHTERTGGIDFRLMLSVTEDTLTLFLDE